LPGAVTVSGTAANLSRGHVFPALSGAVDILGNTAQLVLSSAAPVGPRRPCFAVELAPSAVTVSSGFNVTALERDTIWLTER
jgi:hypothetical protein